MKSSAIGLAFGAAILLSGCYGHSFPKTNTFIADETAVHPATAEVFVDGNGTFYPEGWQAFQQPVRSWKEDSLLNDSNDEPAFRALIERDEARQLAELEQFAAGKDRIFILVHGYNNTVDEAVEAYRLIEDKLPLTGRDGVIRFYWDGLWGTGAGPIKIWFNATGYSQLAGSRGLRRVLNQLSGKTVYLIGHSRGTSVILSALSNPVYDPDFRARTLTAARTWGGSYDDLTSPAGLEDKGNEFHIMVMAPAVDRIDFCAASEQPSIDGGGRCSVLRPLGPQVQSFRYTVNSKDSVLRKFVGLSKSFNPTGLGLRAEVGEGLKSEAYPMLQPYVFAEPSSKHKWTRYIAHATFAQMLSDAGLGARD